MRRTLRAVLVAFASSFVLAAPATAAPPTHGQHAQHPQHAVRAHAVAKHVVAKHARAHRVARQAAEPAWGFGIPSLVATARRFLGTNPTHRRTLWCGAFTDFVLRLTGHKGGGDLALAYKHYGHRVPGPRVGAIAVMRRNGLDASGARGGHVGIVSGVDSKGNPIVISGNFRNTVAEAVFPKGSVVAYVMP